MPKIRKKITIYTDGACSNNPGRGGWGFLIRYEHDGKMHEKTSSGAETLTTNNRMELQAAISALESIKESCDISLYTDSKYLIEGITKWVNNWEKNNWKTANKKDVKNKDLWIKCQQLQKMHHINWLWVKGHSGDPLNEQVDQLAKNAITQ